MMKSLLLHPEDNVAVALEAIPAGASVTLLGMEGPGSVEAQRAIPFAHKIAVRRIAKGEAIRKYGVPVAVATADIAAGEWVHKHNARSCFEAPQEVRS